MDIWIYIYLDFVKSIEKKKNHKNRKLTEFNSHLLHNTGEGDIAKGTTSLPGNGYPLQ